MSKHKLSNQALLNKAKLWCVLHGITIQETMRDDRTHCPTCPNRNPETHHCGLKWIDKLSTNNLMNECGYETDRESSKPFKFSYCIEWIKYV